MLKKMLLTGAVILAGWMLGSPKADAQFGSVIHYGSPIVSGPVIRTYNPYVGPRYTTGYRYGYQSGFYGPVYQSGFRGPVYHSGFRGPVYQSGFRGPLYQSGFRGPFVPGGFAGPMYGPGLYGNGFGRGGVSLNVGPIFRGW